MNKIYFREHRGGLKESMDTMRTFNSMNYFLVFLVARYSKCFKNLNTSSISFCFNSKYDSRIGWCNVFLVCIDGDAVGHCSFDNIDMSKYISFLKEN